MPDRIVIEVGRGADGRWEVRRQDGRAIARCESELEAWEIGRELAERVNADLVSPDDGPEPMEDALHELRVPVRSGTAKDSVADERKRLILLVEDMVDARELYAEYLNYAGFSVVTAINGHEALGLARLLRPDLVLMDIRLPGMDGLEATTDLKADPELSHIPVVAITADSSADIGERARRAGCSTVIYKPVLPDEVARTISRVLAVHQPQRTQP